MLADQVRLQRTWLDRYYDLFVRGRGNASISAKRSRLLLGSTCAGILLVIVNASLARIGGFWGLYSSTYQTYLALAGIVWVMSFLRWGTLELQGAIEHLADHYSGRHVRDPVAHAVSRITSDRLTLMASLLVAAFLVTLYHTCWVRDTFEYLPRFLDPLWYQPPALGLKRAAITWVLVLAGFLIGTSGFQIAYFSACFVRVVVRSYGFRSAQLALESLSPFSKVSVTATWSWSIGIVLTLISLLPGRSPVVWTLITVFSAVAIAVYTWPQLRLHEALAAARGTSLSRLRRAYDSSLEGVGGVGWDSRGSLGVVVVNALEQRYEAARSARTWFVSARGLAQLAFALLAPIAAAFSDEIRELVLGILKG